MSPTPFAFSVPPRRQSHRAQYQLLPGTSSRQSFPSRRARDRDLDRPAREILGRDSPSCGRRPQPARRRCIFFRRSSLADQERRALHFWCRLLSHASRGAHGTRPSRGKSPLPRPAFRRKDWTGSRATPGERIPRQRRTRFARRTWRRKAAVNFRQILTAPNQLTLLRMIILPFIVINLVKRDFKWALALFVLAGISDGLDGLLARTLHQQTLLGQYLDPIADKLLMSTMFLVLSIERMIPWKYTILVFSRDVSILMISGVLFMIAGLRDFRPSIFGKANTFAQVAAVFFVLLLLVEPVGWVWIARTIFLKATFIFTIVSAVHYAFIVQHRLHATHSAIIQSSGPVSK